MDDTQLRNNISEYVHGMVTSTLSEYMTKLNNIDPYEISNKIASDMNDPTNESANILLTKIKNLIFNLDEQDRTIDKKLKKQKVVHKKGNIGELTLIDFIKFATNQMRNDENDNTCMYSKETIAKFPALKDIKQGCNKGNTDIFKAHNVHSRRAIKYPNKKYTFSIIVKREANRDLILRVVYDHTDKTLPNDFFNTREYKDWLNIIKDGKEGITYSDDDDSDEEVKNEEDEEEVNNEEEVKDNEEVNDDDEEDDDNEEDNDAEEVVKDDDNEEDAEEVVKDDDVEEKDDDDEKDDDEENDEKEGRKSYKITKSVLLTKLNTMDKKKKPLLSKEFITTNNITVSDYIPCKKNNEEFQVYNLNTNRWMIYKTKNKMTFDKKYNIDIHWRIVYNKNDEKMYNKFIKT